MIEKQKAQHFSFCMNFTSPCHNLQSNSSIFLHFHQIQIDFPLPQNYSFLIQLSKLQPLLKINSFLFFSIYSPFNKSLTNSLWVFTWFLSLLLKNNCIKFEAINIKYSTASTAFPPCTKQCSRPHLLFRLLNIEFSISHLALIILNKVLRDRSKQVVTIITWVRFLFGRFIANFMKCNGWSTLDIVNSDS